MNIARMYTIALGSFGYTEDEARSLYVVAEHWGYFTCQQFLRFIDGKPGKRSLNFVRKIVEQGHASARAYLRNGKVYHLSRAISTRRLARITSASGANIRPNTSEHGLPH